MKTYKDIYELPLKFQYDEISSRVVDSKYQFVFQFINTDYLNTVGESTHKVALEAINGDRKLTKYRAVVLGGKVIPPKILFKISVIHDWSSTPSYINIPAKYTPLFIDLVERILKDLNKKLEEF